MCSPYHVKCSFNRMNVMRNFPIDFQFLRINFSVHNRTAVESYVITLDACNFILLDSLDIEILGMTLTRL